MRPEFGVTKPLIKIEEGGLAGAVRPDHRAQLAELHRNETSLTARRLPKRLVTCSTRSRLIDHAFRSNPSTPSGKNSTISTKNRPMNDIQFWVSVET